jgi:hypothetical protein
MTITDPTIIAADEDDLLYGDAHALPKLKPDVKQRWLDALRSGQYKQTVGRLKDSEGYCCLGVLCDVLKGDLGSEWGDADLKGYDTHPPTPFARHATGDGELFPHWGALINRNDIGGKSFEQIADVIEQYC